MPKSHLLYSIVKCTKLEEKILECAEKRPLWKYDLICIGGIKEGSFQKQGSS
jgi:hypothetical protein